MSLLKITLNRIYKILKKQNEKQRKENTPQGLQFIKFFLIRFQKYAFTCEISLSHCSWLNEMKHPKMSFCFTASAIFNTICFIQHPILIHTCSSHKSHKMYLNQLFFIIKLATEKNESCFVSYSCFILSPSIVSIH